MRSECVCCRVSYERRKKKRRQRVYECINFTIDSSCKRLCAQPFQHRYFFSHARLQFFVFLVSLSLSRVSSGPHTCKDSATDVIIVRWNFSTQNSLYSLADQKLFVRAMWLCVSETLNPCDGWQKRDAMKQSGRMHEHNTRNERCADERRKGTAKYSFVCDWLPVDWGFQNSTPLALGSKGFLRIFTA